MMKKVLLMVVAPVIAVGAVATGPALAHKTCSNTYHTHAAYQAYWSATKHNTGFNTQYAWVSESLIGTVKNEGSIACPYG